MTVQANFRSSRIARGGKALYGAPLGILMLEARFPRIPGNISGADRRLDRIASAIKEGYAQIYMPTARSAAN